MKLISVQELQKKLAQQQVVLIDVRQPEEYHLDSIQGATLLPLPELSVEQLPDREGAIVLYCRYGKRSGVGCNILLGQDPSLDVYSLEGGIMAWRALYPLS